MTEEIKKQLRVLIMQAKVYNQDSINYWNRGDDPLEWLLRVRDCIDEALQTLQKGV